MASNAPSQRGKRASIALASAAVLVGVWALARFFDGETPPNTTAARDRDAPLTAATTPTPLRTGRRIRIPELRPEKLDETTLLTIDGKLDEPAWQSAPKAVLVDVRTGAPNRDFPVNGSVKLLWNATGFYVGFVVSDPDVTGGFEKSAKDPQLWTRDTVEIMVDPDGDGDNTDYYEIQIGPQNLVFDSAFDRYNEPRTEPDGPFGHQEWSSNVTSAVVVTGTLDRHDDRDEGYVVEALLPWKAFAKAKRVPPAIGDTWRLNFYAMQNNGGVAWSPIADEGNFHKASRFGRVVWTEKGAPQRRDGYILDAKRFRRPREQLLLPSARVPPSRVKLHSKPPAPE